MPGGDAQPPTDCVAGLRSIGKILYVYISIQLLYTYVYVDTQTPTTTTPHMLVTGTRIERGNTQQALALRTYSVPEPGFVPPSLGNLKYPFDTKRKMFSKTIDMIHYAFAVS
jgi:hypothetical protein|uniref:Uncharacterized protein n=1 Tax=Mus musculus TaxID=10090 RepID=Q8CDF2_MOUSE|nr:unnamed protein product [Mus musculus]